jgi:hypothetical protein
VTAGGRDRGERDAPTASGVPDTGGEVAVEALRAEPEPEWAHAIRRGRRSRADRLREVFARFDDEDASAPLARRAGTGKPDRP